MNRSQMIDLVAERIHAGMSLTSAYQTWDALKADAAYGLPGPAREMRRIRHAAMTVILTMEASSLRIVPLDMPDPEEPLSWPEWMDANPLHPDNATAEEATCVD